MMATTSSSCCSNDKNQIQETINDVAAIIVPFLAQGHLNQLLQLSCLISSSYQIPVYYLGSATYNRQAKSRANGLNPSHLANIHFHDIPAPDHFPSPPPDPASPNGFSKQLHLAWSASLNLRQPFADFLRDTSSRFRRVVVIHDPMMAFVVQDVSAVCNAESYVFNCISAYSHLSITRQDLHIPVSVEFPAWLPTFEECVPEEVYGLVALQHESLHHRSGDLYNTCRSIEAPYMHILEAGKVTRNERTWAVGPILPTQLSSDNRHKCLEWLDKHEPKSVMYVSFGTTVSLGDEQVKELALGLEQSKVKFLWVIRDADEREVFEGQVGPTAFLEGFEERVDGVGLVLRDWAPQPQILAHPSTGGFMSHCGWNSFIESVTRGVPIAAWPMHSDQPANTALITEVLQVGIVVRGWEQRTELVGASTIKTAMRRLMASGEGDGVRARAEELADSVRRATGDGGSSRIDMDSFIAHIRRS